MLIRKKKIPFVQVLTIGLLPSFLKKFIYRLRGYRIGKGVTLGPGSVILGKNVELGDKVKVGFISIIRADSIKLGRFVTIGSFSMIDTGRLEIGEDSRINEQVIVGGMATPESALIMGKRTIIMEYSFINTTRPVTIGDDSGVGGHCLIFTHGSWLSELEGFPVTFAPISIGRNVWLPWRVFVMPGVTIGDRVVVGANSLVTKSVPANSLVAGSPAKVLRTDYIVALTAEEKIARFKGYVRSFADLLRYHRVQCQLQENDTHSVLEVNYGGKRNKLVATFVSGTLPETGYDVLAHNIDGLSPQAGHGSAGVILDIGNKRRKGTNDVGEEFVKFLSRYGIRFDRVD